MHIFINNPPFTKISNQDHRLRRLRKFPSLTLCMFQLQSNQNMNRENFQFHITQIPTTNQFAIINFVDSNSSRIFLYYPMIPKMMIPLM